MPAVVVDPSKVHEFVDAAAFEDWLSRHHDRETELWIKLHKVASGVPSITPVEAIRICLCWGWIDAIRKGFDERSYLQRYTPRGAKSVWSQVNIDNVARLTADGRMTEHGQRHVDAAKADGRWDRAYSVKNDAVPDDLQRAIDADPAAKAMFETLTAQNRFSLIFRLNTLKTKAGREQRIVKSVEMLREGKTFHPQKAGRGKTGG